VKRLKNNKDVTNSPHLWRETDRILFTVDEAAAMLPDGDTVNVKLNNRVGCIIGCDWPKAKVLEAMSKAMFVEASGTMAARTGFGLFMLTEGGDRYFIETREPVETEGGAS
jgi:hypothetical protein